MFKVGDRIVGVGECDGVDLTGLVGVVRVVNGPEDILGTEFIGYNDCFHTLSGSCNDGHGWWCPEKSLRFAEIVNV